MDVSLLEGIGVRANQPFASVDDLWRRAAVPATSLVQIAEADGFLSSLHMARRETLWAIKALCDEPMPLFAAASSRSAEIMPEFDETAVTLRPMRADGEVVEDYVHLALSLRAHPVSFLRRDLRSRHFLGHSVAVTVPNTVEAPIHMRG